MDSKAFFPLQTYLGRTTCYPSMRDASIDEKLWSKYLSGEGWWGEWGEQCFQQMFIRKENRMRIVHAIGACKEKRASTACAVGIYAREQEWGQYFSRCLSVVRTVHTLGAYQENSDEDNVCSWYLSGEVVRTVYASDAYANDQVPLLVGVMIFHYHSALPFRAEL